MSLALVAASLLAPSLVLGTLISHSSPQNLTWAGQCAEPFPAGILYPHWMPDSFGGLGSPAFYFYPPLPFWIDELVSVISFDLLSVSYRLAMVAAFVLWASGLAMRAWLHRPSIPNDCCCFCPSISRRCEPDWMEGGAYGSMTR